MAAADKVSLRFDWVDGLKAFAIIGILMNHFVEEFGEGPWFSNPSYKWTPFTERIFTIIPEGSNWFIIGIKFLGWLGDMGPGVFILLSGFTLTLSQLRNEKPNLTFLRSRILRIFPLYIAIHVIVLSFILIVNYPVGFKAFSPWVFLSLLGLRFNDSLFFFINPSWWFIWLIFQLYLFFPWLFKLLKRLNMVHFIIITLLITVLSRLAGILHLTYSHNLYYWMTGLFAGTRLFEFTLGMVLAKLITEKSDILKFIPLKPYLLFLSFLAIYVLGFISSWTYTGSLISNILITIGLSGIFYVFYNLISQIEPVKKTLLFIGRNSFSVFLIHQPFMQFASDNLHGVPKIVCLLLIIVLSFPIGYILEKIVNRLVGWSLQNYNKIEMIILGITSVKIVYVLTFLIIIINVVTIVSQINIANLIKLLSVIYLIWLGLYQFISFRKFNKFIPTEFLLFFISAVTFLFVLPPDWMPVFSITLFLVIIVFRVFKLVVKPIVVLILSFIVITGALIGIEQFLRINKPFETGQWGEFPALRMDTKTVYSLIPNKTTHLKYNNYDYILKTNSMGFASPEIDLKKDDPKIFRILIVGDAFSMPEGMNYSSSFPYLLESELKKTTNNRIIQVVNGGVTGYGPNEMLAQIKYYIDTIKPDLIINEFFINEFEEINLSSNDRLRDIGFIKNESKRLQYFGRSQLSIHCRNWIHTVFRVEDPVSNYNKSLMNLYEKSSSFYSDTVAKKLDNYFNQIKTLADKKNTVVWLMYVPGQIEVSSPKYISFYPTQINISDTTHFDFTTARKTIRLLCKSHFIPFIDTKKILKNNPDQPVYFEDSWHWNQTGHKIISQMLVANIIKEFDLEKINVDIK